MVPPFLSSAQIAQELRRAAAVAPQHPCPDPATSSSKARFWPSSARDALSTAADPLADSDDSDDDDDDDGASLIEEHFLPPLSEEAILCKAHTYARVLSPVGQHFATDLPLRVLAVATGFTESLDGDCLTVRAFDGTKELAVSHESLEPDQVEDVAAFLARRYQNDEVARQLEASTESALDGLSLDQDDDDDDDDDGDDDLPDDPPRPAAAASPIPVRPRIRTRPAPGLGTGPLSAPTSGTTTPTPAERARLEALSARTFGDALLSGLSSLASTPARARSPSPPPAVERDARDELLQWYQLAGVGPGVEAGGWARAAAERGRLRAVQAPRRREADAVVSGAGAEEAEGESDGWAAEPAPAQAQGVGLGSERDGDGMPPLSTIRGAEFTFELVQEEVQEETEGESADAEAEAAMREREALEQAEVARRRRARQELVGR